MVLANVVRTALATLVGAALFWTVAHYALDAFAYWYGPRYIRSDEDINDAFLAMLVAELVLLFVGAYLGYRWGRRRARQARRG